VRNKREQEVIQLKKALDDEIKSREVQLQEVRHKNTQQLEQVNNELDNTKKVRYLLLLISTSCLLSMPMAVMVFTSICLCLSLFSAQYLKHR